MKIFVLGSVVQALCWKVEQLPKPGETRTASALSSEIGGKGINVAIGTRRLGADVDTLLGIGHDATGDKVLSLLEQEGVSIAYAWRLAPQSGYGAGFIAADGQNAIAVYPGPNLLLDESHVQHAKSAIHEADLVYGQLETALPAVASAFRMACKNGVRTVLNPSPWQILPKSLLDDTDVLIVNEVEVRELLALTSPLHGSLQECAKFLHTRLASFWQQWPGSLVVVTLGSTGSIAFERNGTIHQVPAFQIEAVDSVGAGDAFASSFCVELCKQTPLSAALLQANACGAIVASRFGVMDALPGQVELLNFFTSPA